MSTAQETKKQYTNEPFLRSEHLLRGGNYAAPRRKIAAVLHDVPLMRKNKAYKGMALQFDGEQKVLGLGITNESLMAVIAGDGSPAKWVGVEVQLEVREVNSASGGTEPAIRLMPPKTTLIRQGLKKQLGAKIEAREEAKQ